MNKYFLYSLVALLIAGIAYIAISNPVPTATDNEPTDNTSPQDNPSTTTEPGDSSTSLIQVTSPQPEEVAGIPLELSGKARGYWFFEATAPVVVTNWDGLIIGEGYITADGDWMTEEYVPFSGTVSYSLPADSYSATGTIIFQRANPSGLPENDDAFEIRVQLTPDGTNTTPPVVQNPSDQSNLIACTDEQKTAEFCTQQYAPVCGLQEVQCVTTPCDPIPQTYSNICTACATVGVISYAAGECSA
jgi:hypothetical protein